MSSKKRIVIIDDEVELGKILLELIKVHYPNTVFISNSQEARDTLLKENFDLIISDVCMPDLAGPDLIRFLRAHGDWTLVMFLTGNADHETLLTAIRLGVVDVLDKPFDPVELIQTIQRVFEIDKRKTKLISEKTREQLSKDEIEKQSKMLGLLHLANEKKKVG